MNVQPNWKNVRLKMIQALVSVKVRLIQFIYANSKSFSVLSVGKIINSWEGILVRFWILNNWKSAFFHPWIHCHTNESLSYGSTLFIVIVVRKKGTNKFTAPLSTPLTSIFSCSHMRELVKCPQNDRFLGNVQSKLISLTMLFLTNQFILRTLKETTKFELFKLITIETLHRIGVMNKVHFK